MPQGGDLTEAVFQILDGDTETCHWPPLLRALYERSPIWAAPPPPVHPPVLKPLTRLPLLGADRRVLMVVGVAPEPPRLSTPDHDGLAAQVIMEGLQQRGVTLDLVRAGAPEPVLTAVDRDLIVIGGPGSQGLSEAINQALTRGVLQSHSEDPATGAPHP